MKSAFATRALELVDITPDANAECEISLGPEMFDLLSGIYKDVPLACVREPMTNALDGMARLLKNDPLAKILPVEIHLPTRLEPYFAVKDYGSGMTHHEVVTIFKTYGKSTKRDSNDEVGGLGIGSKAPYAYEGADQWTMECRLDGKMRIYSAFKNERGIPSLTLVHTVDSIEPNGVTVKIPIPEKDFYLFKQKVADLLPFYPIEVKITGDRLAWERPKYEISGTGWAVKKGGMNNLVIMGNVPYKVDSGWISKHGGLSYDLFRGHSLHLTVPIGQVLMAPTREALKDCEWTFKGIATACALFKQEFRQKVEVAITTAPTLWEALSLLHDSYGIAALRDELKGILWNGQALDCTVGIERYVEKMQETYPDLTLALCENKDRSGKFEVAASEYLRIVPGMEHTYVYYDDMESDVIARKRLRYQMAKLCGAPVHLNGSTEKVGRRRRHRNFADKYGMAYVFRGTITPQELSEALGGIPVLITSQLPDIPKPVNPRKKTKTSVKLFTPEERDHSRWMDWWTPVDVVVEDGGFYVDMEGQGKLPGLNNGGAQQLRNFLRVAIKAGVLPDNVEVYGIPKSLSRIARKAGWIDVVSHARKYAQRLVNAAATDLAIAASYDDLLTDDFINVLLTFENDFTPRRDCKQLLTDVKYWRAQKARLDDIETMADTLNLEIPKPKKAVDMGKPARLLKAAHEKYPMIAVFCEISGSVNYYVNKTEYPANHERVLNYLRKA